MDKEIYIDNSKYILSKAAACGAGYTSDYLTKLCREGDLVCKRMGRSWFVAEDSLNEFVFAQEHKKVLRKQNLSEERKLERTIPEVEPAQEMPVEIPIVKSPVRVEHIRSKPNLVIEAARRKAQRERLIVSPTSPIHTALVMRDFLHKAVALITAVAIVFSTYSFADAQYMKSVARTLKKAADSALELVYELPSTLGQADSNFTQALTLVDVAASSPALSLAALSGGTSAHAAQTALSVYTSVNEAALRAKEFLTPAYWFSIEGGARGAVELSLKELPPIKENTTTITKTNPPLPPAGGFPYSAPVVQKVTEIKYIQTPLRVPQGEQQDFEIRFNQLENELKSEIYRFTAANESRTNDNFHSIALSQRIDNLSGTSITSSTITDSTITSSTAELTTLTVSGTTSLADTVVSASFEVQGATTLADVSISGTLTDAAGFAGTYGYILQTTGTSTQWVATSTLGISGGGGGSTTFTDLTDTPGSHTVNALYYDTGTALATSSNLTFDGTTLTTNQLTAAGTSTLATTTATTFTAADATLTNATSTNFFATAFDAVTATISGTLTALSGAFANLTATNATTTDFVATNSATLATTTVAGDLTVDTNTLRVDASTNRVGIGVSGSLSSALNVNGTIDIGGSDKFQFDSQNYIISSGITSSDSYIVTLDSSERLRIQDTTGAITFNSAYTFPTADGSTNNILTTNGAGTLSWVATSTLGFMASTTDNWVNTTGDTMTGALTMSGTSANIALGSNYLSGDGGDEGISVDSSGNVGVGIDDAGADLHIQDGNAIRNSFSALTQLVIEDNQTAGVSFVTNALGGRNYLYFGDQDDIDVGNILYNHDDNFLSITTNALERVRIDSSGNVGIGTTGPAYPLDVVGQIKSSSDFISSAAGAIFRSDTSDGADTKTIAISGGGAVGSGRGAYVRAYGNEHVSSPGDLLLTSGTTGDIIMTSNVGIGTTTPSAKLSITGDLLVTASTTFNGVEYLWPSADGSSSQVLSTNGSGTLSWAAAGGSSIDGSGASNQVAYWSDADTLTSSSTMTFNGTQLAVAGIPTGNAIGAGPVYINPSAVTSADVVEWTNKDAWDVPDVGSLAKPALADLDNDGDFDLLIGVDLGTSKGYENTGSVNSPTWAVKAAWDAPDAGDYVAPALADLDNDGDYDLLIGTIAGDSQAYENTGSVSSPTWTNKDTWDVADIGGWASPTLADLDNDGDYDLIIGENLGTSKGYENIGSVSSPTWAAKPTWDVPDIGGKARPALADLDGDGDYDLLIGEYSGVSYAYENTGSASSPTWSAKTAWDVSDIGLYAGTTLADLDNDGDYDLLIGDSNGVSQAYENTGAGGASTNTLFGIAVAGSEKLRVNGQGNLSVTGSLTTTGLADINSYLDLDYSGTSAAASITQSSTGDILNLFDDATEVFTVLDGGNVGIGTTSPASKLDVWGDLRAGTSSTPALFVDTSTAAVGFGTAAPLYPLHVAGQCVTADTRLRRRRRRRRGESDEDLESAKDVYAWDNEYVYEYVQIVNIKAGDEIASMHPVTGKLVWSQVNGLMNMGVQDIYGIITQTNRSIKTTGNHPYFRRGKYDSADVLQNTAPTTQKLYKFEVDQSIRFEEYTRDTVIAIANSEHSTAVSIPCSIKRQLAEGIKGRRLKRLAPTAFASAIVYAIQHSKFSVHEVVIDTEYPSYDSTIARIIKHSLPSVEVAFKEVGKKSPAHFAAYKVFKKEVDAECVISQSDITVTQITENAPRAFLYKDEPCASELYRALLNTTIVSDDVKSVKHLDTSSGMWTKASELKENQMIAVVHGDSIVWEKVVKIKKLPQERVYDIEVEGTKNFIGNDIVAHNTYLGATTTAAGHILPNADDTYDLGASATRWRDLYLGPQTLHIGTSATDEATIGYNTTTNMLDIGTDSTTNGDIAFFTDDLYLDKSTGNVGIGTASPGGKLEIKSSAGANYIFTDASTSGYTTTFNMDNTGLDIGHNAGSRALNLQTVGADRLTILGGGNVGIGTTTPGSKLSISGGASIGANYGVAAPSNGLIIEGNVGIGTTTPDSIKLDVEDDIEIGTGTTGCVRDADNTTLVGTCVSDERLKKNIAPLSGTLEALVSLQPVAFQWRNDEFSWLNGQVGTNYGLIAQEVEQIFPGMVHTDDRGYKRVAYDIGLTMKILQGVKEISSIINLSSASTTLSAMTIDAAGNVGIGTSTPAYKLHVVGDIAATSFVNVSTEALKTNIEHISTTTEESILEKIEEMQVAEYHYAFEDEENPLRLGLIAEEAPSEVLSVEGDGVDIYKLATFTLAGVKAQQRQIDSIQLAVDSLQLTVDDLIAGSGAAGEEGGLLATILGWFGNLGIAISENLAQFQQLAAAGFTVGTSEKPNGITLFDEETGDAYCVKIKAGEMVHEEGSCVELAAAEANAEAPTLALIGNNPAEIAVGANYSDLGVAAQDYKGNDLSIILTLGGGPDALESATTTQIQIDTSTSTTYTIGYFIEDNWGNTASTTRTIIVGSEQLVVDGATATTTVATTTEEIIEDTTPPAITLIGDEITEIEEGSDYVDLGATATDEVDGELEVETFINDILIDWVTLDTSASTSHYIEYRAVDQAGNSATANRTVNVVAVPEIVTTTATSTATQ